MGAGGVAGGLSGHLGRKAFLLIFEHPAEAIDIFNAMRPLKQSAQMMPVSKVR